MLVGAATSWAPSAIRSVRQQPDELLAVGPRGVGAGERALAEEVALRRRDDPVHAEILRRHGAVGVLADDRVALLGAQDVHRLGAVRRRLDRPPELEPAAAVHVHLERELAREADAADARRDPGDRALADRHEREALAVERDLGQPARGARASRGRRRRPSPTAPSPRSARRGARATRSAATPPSTRARPRRCRSSSCRRSAARRRA